MEFIKFILFILIIRTLTYVQGQEYCPKSCECDSYENFNRANCRRQKLISALIEISEYVQILNLDENEITVLDNECFKKQIHLTSLSVAYNAIHTIYLNAFSTLKKLTSIDLSYNRLEYINEKIFEYNYQLIEVNLSGNKFMSFPNQPLFISLSVQSLLLQNSQIPHIYPKLFSKMPLLENLDLSENLMITLTTEPFNLLTKLLTINLENNRWISDKNIENVIKMLKSKNIDIKFNMCHFELKKSGNNGNHMFEKMIIDPNLKIETNNEEKSRIIIESVWKKLNKADNDLETCSVNNILYICNLYQQCLNNLTIVSKYIENSKSNIPEINNNKDFFHLIGDTQLIFYFGMCIGASIVFVMVACTLCATKICKSTNKKVSPDMNDLVSANGEFQYLHAERPVQLINQSIRSTEGLPPPIPVRNPRRRRRRPPPPPPLNRSISTPANIQPMATVSNFAAFVTRIFERPSRHRYYRAFNENTAHLIRRLSRSSLVNNRVSQHFLNETTRNRNGRNRNEQPATTEQNTSPLNSTEIDSEEVLRQLIVQLPDENDNNSSNRLLNNRRMSLEEYHGPDIPRPETPPPAYHDAVKL